MSIVINAPALEGKLRQEAARNGVTVSDVATTILTDYFQPHEAGIRPQHSVASQSWLDEFARWIASHETHVPLPDSATSRESFYEGRL